MLMSCMMVCAVFSMLFYLPGCSCPFFFFTAPATPEIYTLSLHDALPISSGLTRPCPSGYGRYMACSDLKRSEEHTSELQSRGHLVCRLLLEKKKCARTTSVTARRTQTTDRGDNEDPLPRRTCNRSHVGHR